ncbi:unnamed protein product [Absidia cylindrospora]
MPHAKSRSQSTAAPQPVNIFSGFQHWRRRRGSTSVPASPLGTSTTTNDTVSFPTLAGLSRASSDQSHQPNQLYHTDDEEQPSLSANVHRDPKSIRNMNTTTTPTAAEASTAVTSDPGNDAPATMDEENLHIRLLPNIGLTSRCFVFDIIDRVLGPNMVLRIGRYSERHTNPQRLSFKSKVVSRTHAELWMEEGKKIFIRDVGSSSGTFVNRIRLSTSNEISAPMELKDGDIIQLGVDYQGGIDMMYRSVKIRLEIDRDTNKTNSFSRQAFQQLRHHLLGSQNVNNYQNSTPDQQHSTDSNSKLSDNPNDINSTLKKHDMTSQGIITSSSNNNSDHTSNIQECCICLYAIAPLQALFVAPCSHVFHFKCLRPIIFQHYPGFSCPLCRNYYDLEASVAIEVSEVAEAMGLFTSSGKSATEPTSGSNQAVTSTSGTDATAGNSAGPISLPIISSSSIMQNFSPPSQPSSSSSPPPIQQNNNTADDISYEDNSNDRQQQNGVRIPGSRTHLQPGNMDGFLLSSTLVDPSMLDQEGGSGNLPSSL